MSIKGWILPVLMLFTAFVEAGPLKWTPAKTIGLNSSERPQVAVDSKGNGVAVWIHREDANSIVQGSTRQAGGEWSDPVAISQPDRYLDYLKMVIDNNGNALAIWCVDDGESWMIQSATLPFGKTGWLPTAEPLSGPAELFYAPQIQVSSQGVVQAYWVDIKDDKLFIESARLKIKSDFSRWAPIESLPVTSNDLGYVRLKHDPAGNATLLWSDYADYYPKNIQAATLAFNSKSWSSPETLYSAPEGDALVYGTQLAIDPQGNAFALFVTRDDSKNYNLEALYRPANSTAWSPKAVPSGSIENGTGFNFGLDNAGNATLVWTAKDPQVPLLSSQLLAATDTWSDPIPVLPPDEIVSDRVMNVDAKGNVLFIWTNEKERTIKAAALPFGSKKGWSAPAMIATNILIDDGPGVAFAPNGTWIFYFRELIETVRTIDGKSL